MSNWMDQGKQELERQKRQAEQQQAERERQAKAEQIRIDLENKQRKQQLDVYKQKLTPFFAPLGAYKILSDVARELGLPDAKIEDGQISTDWSSGYTVELFASLTYSARTSEMQSSPFYTTTREYTTTERWRIG